MYYIDINLASTTYSFAEVYQLRQTVFSFQKLKS